MNSQEQNRNFKYMKTKTKFGSLCPNWNFSLDNQKYLNEIGIECTESWRQIRGYNGLYEISDLGRLKSYNWRNTGRVMIITPKVTIDGYLSYKLSKNKFYKVVTVHRLVAISFNKGFNKSLEVNHKDGNKLNNHPSNLEWVTHAENMAHYGKVIYKKGEKSVFEKPGITLTKKQVFDIRNGIYDNMSTAQLSRKLNVGWSTIDNVRKGKSYIEIPQKKGCGKHPKWNNNKSGEYNPKSTLTEKDVLDIRLGKHTGKSIKQIANIYRCVPTTISNVIKRRTWTHI